MPTRNTRSKPRIQATRLGREDGPTPTRRSGWRSTCRPGWRPIGGLPKDLDDLVVPPLQSLTHDADWLDSVNGRGFHGGILDDLAHYYT